MEDPKVKAPVLVVAFLSKEAEDLASANTEGLSVLAAACVVFTNENTELLSSEWSLTFGSDD